MTHAGRGIAAALFVLIIAPGAGYAATCATTIVLERGGGGALTVRQPDAMLCKAGEEMTIRFENRDTVAHRFQVSDIACKAGNGPGKNPTRGFLRAPTEVNPGGSEEIRSGPQRQKPAILARNELPRVNCAQSGSPDYHYKYSIRVSARGGNAPVHASLDPDLEVSPP